MKRKFMGLFLVLGIVSFAANAGKVEVKGAYDLGGKYHYDNSSEKAKSTAGEAGAEYRYELTPGFEVGAGTAYQWHKKVKARNSSDENYENYNSVPVYGTAKYTFATPTTVKPYVKGDLGYSANNGNIDDYKAKNGLYYGVGAGVNYNNFNAEVMYKENQGQYKNDNTGDKTDANYKRVSVGVGYNFNLGN